MAFLLVIPAMMNWICHKMAFEVLSWAELVVSRRKALDAVVAAEARPVAGWTNAPPISWEVAAGS